MRLVQIIGLLLLLTLTAQLQAASLAEKEWTVLVYIAGDNNLSASGLDDVNEMEMVGSTDSLNIVVQIDGSENFTPEAADTRRYFIEKDDKSDVISSPKIADLDEVDMGSQASLEDFLNFGAKNYPAKKYAVIIWNHGNGWYPDDGLHRFNNKKKGPYEPLKAICSDETSDNAMSTAGLGDVLEDFSRTIGRKIEFVGFDACLMGMAETFYEIRGACKYSCASEKTEPGDGWPYDEWLAILAANPAYNGEELGKTIVETYTGAFNNGSQGTANVTLSCIRLSDSAITNFEASLDLFADELTRVYAADPEGVKNAVEATQDFRVRSFFGSYFTTHRDLYDFAKNIAESFSDDDDLTTAAELVMEAISSDKGLVVVNGITDVSPYGTVKQAHGLAIYLPTDGYEETYESLDFASTGWFRFLKVLNEGKTVKAPGGQALAASKEYLFGNLHENTN